MNLAYRILLPGFHADTCEHRNTPRALQNDLWPAPAQVHRGSTPRDLVHKDSPSLPCRTYHLKSDLSTAANHCVSWDSGKEPEPHCNVGYTISP